MLSARSMAGLAGHAELGDLDLARRLEENRTSGVAFKTSQNSGVWISCLIENPCGQRQRVRPN